MLDLLLIILLGMFIYIMFAVFVIAIGILTIVLLKDIQRKIEENERSDN